MKQKHIDAAREARLWIGQIIVPGVMLITTTLTIPGVRDAISAKAEEIKNKIIRKES